MKKAIICLSVFSLIFSTCYAAQTCQQDWECGSVPYSLCEGSDYGSLANGIAVDDNDNVYFSKGYYTPGITQGNFSIETVPANGGPSSLLYVYVPETYAERIESIYHVTDDGEYVHFSVLTRGNPGGVQLKVFQRSTGQIIEIPFTSESGNRNYIDLSIDDDSNTYVCTLSGSLTAPSFFIEKFNGLLGVGSDLERTTVYNLGTNPCTNLVAQVDSDNLWIELRNGTILRGSKSCVECDSPSPIAGLPQNPVTDIYAYEDRLYLAGSFGVVSYDFNGQNKITFTESVGKGIEVQNDVVYFSTETSGLYSANVDGNNVAAITLARSCQCRSGFTGPNCQQCDGQVQWLDGIPECVSIGNDGFPEKCSEAWQCGGVPFTICNGKCACLQGFIGAPECNRCANATQTIVWNDNKPSCQ